MTKLAKLVAGLLGLLLGMVLLTALSLFIVAAYLCTYPLLRMSPRDARLKAVLDVALAVTAAAGALKGAAEHEQSPNDT